MRTTRRPTRLRGLRALARPLALEVYAVLVDQLAAARRHRLPEPPLRLNLGCGPNVRGGWVNIDLDPRADLQFDLRERLPFPDGCATLIVAEHTFEHLDYPRDTAHFLSECLRLLAPSGRLALSVPDAEIGLRRYAADDVAFFAWASARWQIPARHTYTPLATINYVFRQDGQHRYAYDAETLIALLVRAGFVNATVREFEAELDTEDRRDGSLRVTAYHP